MASKEYELRMKISGRIDPSLASSVRGAKSIIKGMDGAFTTLDKGYNAIMAAGKRAFHVVAVAAAAAATAVSTIGTKAVQSGMQMESAFAKVKKTTDATAQQYKELKNDIFTMMQDTPADFETIAGTMMTGGQLGIDIDSLSDFTKVMTDIGLVSNDISADEAATNFARLQNILGFASTDELGVSNWERLGSTLLTLGNTFATTEGSIAPMAMRLAATGKQVNLSAAQILGLSTAMSSVGIKEAVGGSTMSKLLKKMQLAVETGAGLSDYANVSGMSDLQFAATFKNDATEGVKAFIGGLSGMLKGGKDLSGVMEKLGMNVELTSEDLQELGMDEETALSTLSDMKLDEIRLSNTILALAGGYDTLVEALDSANTAWEENTGLTRYTEDVYNTVESKIQLMKNSLQQTSDTIYQDVRGPLADTIDWLTGKFYGINDYLGSSNGLKKWIEDIQYALPTFKRKASTLLQGPLEAIQNAFQWIVKNKAGVIGALTGIAAALAAYKVLSDVHKAVQGISSIFKMLGSGPVGWIVLGLTALAAAITGVVTALKIANEEAKQLSLDEHFGNISLTMKELEEVADGLVSSEALTNARLALEQFSELDNIQSQIEQATKTIHKLQWKIEIGIDLTDEDKNDYVQGIQDYVDGMNEYAEGAQYGVQMSMNGLFDEDDTAGQTIAQKIIGHFNSVRDQIAKAGEELANIVNEAFENNLLEDVDVQSVIAEKMQQIAELQSRIAMSDYKANLMLLDEKYGGANLTGDSFLNLVDEINKHLDEASTTYDEEYKNRINAALLSDNLSEDQLNTVIAQAGTRRRDQMMELYGTNTDFLLNSIASAYSEELAAKPLTNIGNSINDQFGWMLEEAFSPDNTDLFSVQMNMEQTLGKLISSFQLDDAAARGNMADFYEILQPTLTAWQDFAQEFVKAGEEVPQSVEDSINAILAIGARGGVEDAIYQLIGQQLSFSPEYAAAIRQYCEKLGLQVPEGLLSGIEGNAGEVEGAANDMGVSIPDNIAAGVESNIFQIDSAVGNARDRAAALMEQRLDLTIPVTYTIEATASNLASTRANIQNTVSAALSGMGGHYSQYASGGFINHPEFAQIGEDGPEVIIPLDGSSRAYDLLSKTNKLMSMKSRVSGVDLSGAGGHTIEYKPTLQFYGDAPTKKDLTEAMEISQDKFEQLMNDYIRNNARVAF